MKPCRFSRISLTTVVCLDCGQVVETRDAPERVHASCQPAADRPEIIKGAALTGGPGTELKALLKSIGVSPSPNCDCNRVAAEMDRIGTKRCIERKAEFVEKLQAAYLKSSWLQRITAAGMALKTGVAFKINWINPVDGLFDEALRRSVK